MYIYIYLHIHSLDGIWPYILFVFSLLGVKMDLPNNPFEFKLLAGDKQATGQSTCISIKYIYILSALLKSGATSTIVFKNIPCHFTKRARRVSVGYDRTFFCLK